jgi:hypothetical protein
MSKSLFLSALIIILVLAAGAVLWQYNAFIFKRAAGQISAGYLARFEKYRIELVKFFPFSQENALREWEEKIFKGKVVYRIEKSEDLSYVKATSRAAASALYYKIKLDARRREPVISWKWNVDKFPLKKMKESLTTENEDDFAARVYMIFPAAFLLNSKVLEYIWAETIPVGTMGTSPYSKNIKLIVARSGSNPNKEWFLEERDIIADYKKAFGTFPDKNIGAVAFMTNTEHTGSDAISMYTNIRLGYKDGKIEGGG